MSERFAVIEIPTDAVVPYADDARRIRRAVAALPLDVHVRWVAVSLGRMARQVAEMMVPTFRRFGEILAEVNEQARRFGWVPPDPTMLKHGTVWTSPLDGHQLRVRGRRGRPRTFHWGRP